jgi:hypothetical protein
MRTSFRVVLIAVGVVLIVIGLFVWSIEDEYGSGLNFATEVGDDGTVTVYEVDEAGGREVLVFEGTPSETFEYMERRRSAGESFVTPIALIAIGAALVLLALVPSMRSIPDLPDIPEL